jgi:HJR/Mrr/RecB family endonuclease
MTMLSPGEAQSRLEMTVELLHREWREGCPAGMAYQTALGSVRRLRLNAALDPTESAPGRIPVETRRYIDAEREAAYALAREEVARGHQILVICPLVEALDAVEAKGVVDEADRLSLEVFPELRIATLHERMELQDKDAIMADFRDRLYDMLVSTPVTAVGIDVPNATVMLIEGADRFGLAQLHQLRGRVGRSGAESFCVLLADEGSPASEERLESMVATDDDFLIALKDRELGGQGDFVGTRQTGLRDQITAELAAVIDDLEAYVGLPVERRPAALTTIANAIKRLILLVSSPSSPVQSIPTLIATLHRLSPSAFEYLVADLLKAQGYEGVKIVGGANDRGVDIICRDTDGSLIAVQCKRYDPNKPSGRVGAPVVQLLSAMALHRRAHRGILVTTARFTESARKQAYDFDIELIDGEALVEQLSAHPRLLASLQMG